jgi:hypothetical protein
MDKLRCTVLREDRALLGCYAASSDSSLQTFRENLWVGPEDYPETSASNRH